MRLAASLAVYNALLALLALVALPIVALGGQRTRRMRQGLLERLTPLPPSERETIWVHAASVGEVETAVPLVRALQARGEPLVLTALSVTGRERLRSRFADLAPRLAPLDLPLLTGLGVRRARVGTLVLIETELWPNAIAAVKRRGGRVMVASARLSDASFGRYSLLRVWLAPLLGTLDAVAARSDLDRARFVELGVCAERARVVGDLKLDAAEAPEPSPALRAAIGAGPLLLAASTHPGEDGLVLEAWQRLRRRASALRLALVPRHPERAIDVAARARALGVKVALRSEGGAQADVVVVDTLGELRSLYALADLVIAGGTLVPIGGHNLIEPTLAGRVVLAGPYLENQRDQVALLAPFGALRILADPAALPAALEQLWDTPDRDAPARTARDALAGHRGACERILRWLDRLPEDADGGR